jgi:putative DNA primase/helicase
LPAIFNWALDGLQKLRARGRFEQPAASKQAIQEMEDLASPVGAFVRDRCTLGPQHSIETQKLYQTYQQWCLDTGTKAANFATFGRDLRAVCPEIKVSRLGGRGHRTATYVGVSMGGRYGTYGTESTEVEE